MSIYTMGIDVGSTASKCVIMKDGQEIVAKSLVPVGTGTSGPARAIAEVLDNAKMTREQMDFVLATGYGRNSLDGLADLQMSELSCHAKGATYLFPDVHTVVDIGGQDVKVIEIENGMMKNFVMNDKCAAGTGRFLDVMARVLEVRRPRRQVHQGNRHQLDLYGLRRERGHLAARRRDRQVRHHRGHPPLGGGARERPVQPRGRA